MSRYLRTAGEPETGGSAAVFGVAALPLVTEYRLDMRAAFRAFGESAVWELRYEGQASVFA